MADVAFSEALAEILRADIDFVSDDIRVALLMTNAVVQTGAATVSAITTLDEMDGSAYVRKALANQAVTADDTNNRGEFDADDVTWTTLGAGTRSIRYVLYYLHVTNDADSIPIYAKQLASDFTADGTDLILNFDAEGILQLGV